MLCRILSINFWKNKKNVSGGILGKIGEKLLSRLAEGGVEFGKGRGGR